MSTSKVHKAFVSEPIGDKPTNALPGIGKVSSGILADKGIRRADAVFGQYLAMNQDGDRFKGWLMSECGANAKQRSDCLGAVKEWRENHMA